MCVRACVLGTELCQTVWLHELETVTLCCPWNSLGKNTGVGYHSLFQVSATHHCESAIGIHTPPPSWPFFPPPTPSHPARLTQSAGLSSLSHTANSQWLPILCMVMYMFPSYSLNSSQPLPPTLHPQVCSLCLHLHCHPKDRGSSVPFFYIPCTSINIWYLSFSFWPTSLCRFIHLIRTESNAFHFMAE